MITVMKNKSYGHPKDNAKILKFIFATDTIFVLFPLKM